MKITKERRIYFVIAGLAIGALGIDRFVLQSGLSSPASASAGVEDAAAASALPLPVASPPHMLGAEAGVALAIEHLRASLPDAARASDAFAMPANWGGREAAPAPQAEERREPPRAATPAIVLTSILSNVPRPAVGVDGKLVRVGETINGLKLVEVRERSAVFESPADGARIEVAMPLPEKGRGKS